MSPKMKETLEMLCKGKEAYVHYSTAYALQERGYVNVGNIPKKQMTESGNFPCYIVTLTNIGKKYCESRGLNQGVMNQGVRLVDNTEKQTFDT